MEFYCSECNYKSDKKAHVNNHLNKINKCGINPHIIEVKIEIKCEYCKKHYKYTFIVRNILNTHLLLETL